MFACTFVCHLRELAEAAARLSLSCAAIMSSCWSCTNMNRNVGLAIAEQHFWASFSGPTKMIESHSVNNTHTELLLQRNDWQHHLEYKANSLPLSVTTSDTQTHWGRRDICQAVLLCLYSSLLILSRSLCRLPAATHSCATWTGQGFIISVLSVTGWTDNMQECTLCGHLKWDTLQRRG